MTVILLENLNLGARCTDLLYDYVFFGNHSLYDSVLEHYFRFKLWLGGIKGDIIALVKVVTLRVQSIVIFRLFERVSLRFALLVEIESRCNLVALARKWILIFDEIRAVLDIIDFFLNKHLDTATFPAHVLVKESWCI